MLVEELWLGQRQSDDGERLAVLIGHFRKLLEVRAQRFVIDVCGILLPGGHNRRWIDESSQLVDEFRAIWRARFRPGGIDDSLARLEKMSDPYLA